MIFMIYVTICVIIYSQYFHKMALFKISHRKGNKKPDNYFRSVLFVRIDLHTTYKHRNQQLRLETQMKKKSR